jgi:spore germination protein GerM
MRQVRNYQLAIVVFMGLAIVAACGPSLGGLGTVPPVPSAPAPSVGQASPDLTPGPLPASPSPSSAPSGGTSPSAAPPTSTPTSGTTIVRAYFHLDALNDDLRSAGLVPVLREVAATKAVAAAAMTGLLAGPSAAESRTMSSAIPEGTRLLGLSIADGIARVDLSHEFESGGGSASVLGRLAQVAYTLTQFPTVHSVSFLIEGRPVTVFSGEGVVLTEPVGRDDYHDFLPAIFVDRPAHGAAIGNPARIAGLANVFEATLQVALLDGARRTIVEQVVTATCGTGCWGTFDVTLPYAVAKAQWGTLRVWVDSAKDGSPVNVREYPVWLTPAA